jgi:hypothetical protein
MGGQRIRAAVGATRRATRIATGTAGRWAVSISLECYIAAALLVLIGAHGRWHRLLGETLSGTFLTVSGGLTSWGRPWLGYGVLLFAILVFAVARRLSSGLANGPARWVTMAASLTPSVIVIWALTGYELEFLFADLMLVSFASLLGSLSGLPDPAPRVEEWRSHSAEKQLVLLHYEADKYWKGLNILWAATAAGIAALAAYVISAPPSVWNSVVSMEQLHALTEARIWIAMALLGAFVPGVIWIVGAIVVRVNRIHRALADLEIP